MRGSALQKEKFSQRNSTIKKNLFLNINCQNKCTHSCFHTMHLMKSVYTAVCPRGWQATNLERYNNLPVTTCPVQLEHPLLHQLIFLAVPTGCRSFYALG